MCVSQNVNSESWVMLMLLTLFFFLLALSFHFNLDQKVYCLLNCQTKYYTQRA